MLRTSRLRSLLILLVFWLTACTTPGTATPTLDTSPLMTRAAATVFSGVTQTAQAMPTATDTPTPTPTPLRTPPALPVGFGTALLNPLDTPHTYLQDTCQALRDKWSSGSSAPGTVIMVIMFHSIAKDVPAQPFDMTETAFYDLMAKLKANGFNAINATQARDFLEHNARIPTLSFLPIADDRRTKLYFDTFFRPYWQQNGWPVVSGWISTPYNTASQWQEQAELEAEGWVDHEAHGVGILAIDETFSDTYILNELNGSITAFEQHFNKRPLAYIWAGGGFSPRAVELARQSGYQLGFTINPRGPLLFNWIPQADGVDPARPLLIPEGPAHDPQLTLPRYWSTDAALHLDTVIQISHQAAAYAEQGKATELEYYDIICAPAYGPIP
jgi:hypothetical protein